MSYLPRFLLLIPVVYLVMLVYVAPRSADGQEILKMALPKTAKVLFWVAVLIVVMQLLHWLFLP